MQARKYERMLQGNFEAKEILQGHTHHIYDVIDRVFHEYPVNSNLRRVPIYEAVIRTMMAIETYARFSPLQNTLMYREIDNIRRANDEDNKRKLVQAADTILEMLQQIIERNPS